MAFDPETRTHLGVGLLQAGLAYALFISASQQSWPSTQPAVFFPLFFLMVLGPLAFYLANAAPTPRRRVEIAWGAGGLALAIGLYQGLTTGLPRDGKPFLVDHYLPPTLILAAALLALVPAAAVAVQRRVRYEPWFDAVLHNALLLAQGGFVTGLFWVVLRSAASLFKLVGVDPLERWVEKPEFWIPATALVFSYGVSLAVKDRSVARFLLDRLTQLCGWIYPLAGALGVAFVASWLLQGIEPLLKTKSAAWLLLWFSVLSVLLVNASSRGGLDAPPYPRWMRRALSAGLLVLLPMATVALYALWLRVAQYGWTVDRIWGFFVATVISVFALGYALNTLLEWRGRAERCGVPTTNAAAAAIAVAGVLLMLGGVLDPRRLSVNDQLGRLAGNPAGQADAVRYLAREGGRFGQRALEGLAQEGAPSTGTPAAVQRLARDALRSAPERGRHALDTANALPVYPVGTTAPPALRAALAAEGELAACSPDDCLIWRLPSEVGGAETYVLLERQPVGYRASARAWTRETGDTWKAGGTLAMQGIDAQCHKQNAAAALFDAVRSGTVQTQPRPTVLDLSVDGLRFPLTRWKDRDGC